MDWAKKAEDQDQMSKLVSIRKLMGTFFLTPQTNV